MHLTIQQHEVGTVTVLRLHGRLTLEGSNGSVEDAVGRAIGSGRKQIVLDVRDVDYVDSAGLGELVSSYARGLAAGASVKVEHANTRLLELLEITHLRHVLMT